MRLRVVTLFLLSSAFAAMWACGLNPQPLPPGAYDGSADTALATNPDTGAGADGSAIDGNVPSGDDAAADADDSGDASDDASDAAEDARDDASDAGEDG